MKRFLLLITCLCLLFLLTACGSGPDGVWVAEEDAPANIKALTLTVGEEYNVASLLFADGTSCEGVWADNGNSLGLHLYSASNGNASAFAADSYKVSVKKNALVLALPEGDVTFTKSAAPESPVGVWQVDAHLNFDTYEVNPDILEYMVIKEDGTLDLYFTASYDAPAVLEATWETDDNGDLSLQFGGKYGDPGAAFFKGPYMFYGFFNDSPADIRFVKVDALPQKDTPDEDDILDPYTVGDGFGAAGKELYIYAPTADRVEADARDLFNAVDITADSAWYPGLNLSDVWVNYNDLSYHEDDFILENSPELYKAAHMRVSLLPDDREGRSTYPVWSTDIWYQLVDGHWVISTHTASGNLSTAYTH